MGATREEMVFGAKRLGYVGDRLDKDKEAFFNVAFNVTDNISSQAILRHNNYIFNRYLPALRHLPSTTPFLRASAMELLVPLFTPLVWCGRGIRTHDLPLRKRTL